MFFQVMFNGCQDVVFQLCFPELLHHISLQLMVCSVLGDCFLNSC